jgi:hypothetical protein
MTKQRAAPRKVSSFVAPTEDDLAYFDGLSASEQRALLQAEIDKGFTGGLGNRTFDEIVAEARASTEARRSRNG